MPLNEYRYLKKTDKGQHIDLATGQPQDDKVFDAMDAVTGETDVEKSLKGDTKEATHTALMAGGFIPGPVGVVSDAVDAFLYIKEGKPGQAILAGLSILPFGSAVFRGLSKASDQYKSISVAGKRVPVKDAIRYIDKFETDVARDFDVTARIVGGKKYKRWYELGLTPSKNPLQVYTTKSAVEATSKYGPGFWRIEMDPRVLKEMSENVVQKGAFKGERLLYKLDQPYSDIKHFMFSDGLPLNRIEDLTFFTDYFDYLDWGLREGLWDVVGYGKLRQRWAIGQR